jgi:hypothetical protein
MSIDSTQEICFVKQKNIFEHVLDYIRIILRIKAKMNCSIEVYNNKSDKIQSFKNFTISDWVTIKDEWDTLDFYFTKPNSSVYDNSLSVSKSTDSNYFIITEHFDFNSQESLFASWSVQQSKAKLDLVLQTFDIVAIRWFNDELVTGEVLEYYSDPAFFFVDLDDVHSENIEDVELKHFVTSKKVLNMVNRIKSRFNTATLKNIVKGNKENIRFYFGENAGLGIVKKNAVEREYFIYPRFFNREALRNEGFNLPPGNTERKKIESDQRKEKKARFGNKIDIV